MRKEWLKYLYMGITTAALTGGAAFGVYRYQSGSRFTPKGNAPALQENRVSFDEEDSGKLGDASASQDETTLLEKDPASEDRQEPAKNDSEKLFLERLPERLPGDAELVGILDPTALPQTDASSETGENGPSLAYDLRGDGAADAASTVTGSDRTGRGRSVGGNVGGSRNAGGSSGNGGTGSNENAGSGNPDVKQNGTENEALPEPTPQPEPAPDPNPTKPGKAETVGDPKPAAKPSPGLNAFGEPVYNYSEDSITGEDEDSLQVLLSFMDVTKFPERFYKGQRITAEMLYNAMTTEVVKKEDFTTYAWGEKDLDKYVRIDAVSFDGGGSWEEDFPLTIPQETSADMLVQVSYRFRETEEWMPYRSAEDESGALPYTLAEGRVFVLSKALPEDAASVPEDSILNTYHQYPAVGTAVSLWDLDCIGGVLAENDGLEGIPDTETLNNTWFDWYAGVRQTKLFTGWQEDGEVVSWNYLVAKGRHILEPGELTEIDPRLEVRLKLYWLSHDEDGSWQADFSSDNMYYMQTLCGFADGGSESYFTRVLQRLYSEMRGFTEALTVPEGVQFVDFEDTDDETEKLYADLVQIPASVLYIDTDSTGLRVEQGYAVDAENPCYSAEDGVLYNKQETALLAVPYEDETLTVPETVETVRLSSENRLREVRLEAENRAALPTLSVDRLQNCRIVLADDLLNDFAARYESELEENGNTLGAAGDEENAYCLTDGLLLRQDGCLRLALPRSQSILTLSDAVTEIGSYALSELDSSTETLQLGSCEEITLAENALAGSPVQTILCQSEAQLAFLQKQLEKAGIRDISLSMAQTSLEGYRYRLEDNDGGAVLLKAPENIEGGEFDGTLTAADGSLLMVTEIADGAFRGNESLRWAELPDSVRRIGYGAFEDCTNLEGLLIGAGWPAETAWWGWPEWPDPWHGEWPHPRPDTWEEWQPEADWEIEIGENALAGCDSLRFAASNVPKAHMVNDYDPEIYDFTGEQAEFYVLSDAEGYGSNAVCLADVTRYRILTLSDGSRVLYGLDAEDTPWLALRSGKTITALALPESTVEIYTSAFSDTESGAGESYSLALPEKDELFYIDEFAFAGASLGGALTLPENDYVIADYAFQDTRLTTVSIGGRLQSLGDGAFYNCDALTALSIACFDGAFLPDGLLTDCESFCTLSIESGEVPALLCYTGLAFQLNHALEPEAECESITLRLPEGTDPEAVVEAWRYGFACGYTGTAHEDMWHFVYGDLIDWDTWTLPTDEEVDAEVARRLAAAEQRIRCWISAEDVIAASDSDIPRDDASAASASDMEDFPEADTSEEEETETLSRSTDSEISIGRKRKA